MPAFLHDWAFLRLRLRKYKSFFSPVVDFHHAAALVFHDQLLLLAPFVFFHDNFGNGNGETVRARLLQLVNAFFLGHGFLPC